MTKTQDSFLLRPHWAKIGVHDHHGVCIPLSGIRSAASCGVGEILDLIPMISWLRQSGFSTLQLLPINDSGYDPSPYMAISSCALHPIYLSMRALPGIPRDLQEKITKCARLNEEKRVPYQAVLKQKMALIRSYLEGPRGVEISARDDYGIFVQKEASWLIPYALFRAMKELEKEKAWWHFSRYQHKPDNPEALLESDPIIRKEFDFWVRLQFILFQQWAEVRAHAEKMGVRILGDLPILVNKDSADVWWHRELFSLDVSVGAPPDMYSKDGQSWGFPIYRWDRMKQERYSWFSNRIALQSQLYDMYRIDHIVGLFRFWAVPPNTLPKNGFFIPATTDEWLQQGEKMLHVLAKASDMLPIGEDLGVIPDQVRHSMRRYGIPGVKILRWERKWNEGKDPHFIDPKQFSPESLVSVSTHDSSTLAGWWDEEARDREQFCREMNIASGTALTPQARFDILQLSHQASSLIHINLLQEYLGLEPALAWGSDPIFDRINIPGTVSDMNWTWKTKTSIEEIASNDRLTKTLQQLSSSHERPFSKDPS